MPELPTFTPFTRTATHRIYDSPWVSLRRDELTDEHNSPLDHHVIEIVDAVCIVPIRTDDQLVIIGQYRYPHGHTHWEFPAGRLEPGESPLDGAIRELREETGHTADRFVELPGFYPVNGISDHWVHLYAALDCRDTNDAQPESRERLEPHVVPQLFLAERIANGEIRDGFTRLAWYSAKAANLLG